MKNFSLLVALLLTVQLAGAAQGYRPTTAGAVFATDRGQYFSLVLDGQPLTRGPVPQLQVAALVPGQHWAEFMLPGDRRRGDLRFRASVWLESGFETQFVLYLRPGCAPLLRQEGAVALLPPGSYSGSYGNDDDDYYPGGYGGDSQNPDYSVMSPPEVAALVQALQRRSFDSSRLDLAKQALCQTVIRADDFRQVLRAFDFDASRTALATFGYQYVADRQNFYRVYDAFDFESNARSVQRAVARM